MDDDGGRKEPEGERGQEPRYDSGADHEHDRAGDVRLDSGSFRRRPAPGKSNLAYRRYAGIMPVAESERVDWGAARQVQLERERERDQRAPTELDANALQDVGFEAWDQTDVLEQAWSHARPAGSEAPAKTTAPGKVLRLVPQATGQSAQDVAAHGFTGPAAPLPHQAQIQRAFGRHDVSGVTAHIGGPAAAACDALGAVAYASGDQVAFREQPDVHTASHELAHVFQQRGGVSLKDGVGQDGDVHEQHADRVADLVVRGEPAEALLDNLAGAPQAGQGPAAVQRKARSSGASADGQRYTAKDSQELVELALRAAAVEAQATLDQLDGAAAGAEDREAANSSAADQCVVFEGGCLRVDQHLRHVFDSSVVAGVAAPSLSALCEPSDLAASKIEQLLAWAADHDLQQSPGCERLHDSLARHARLMAPTGWRPPRADSRPAGGSRRSARHSDREPGLGRENQQRLITLSLATARQQLKGSPNGKTAGKTGSKSESIIFSATLAGDQVVYAGRLATRATTEERRELLGEIRATSEAIGDFRAWAMMEHVGPDDRFERLFMAEDRLLETVGLPPAGRFIEQHGDADSIAAGLQGGKAGLATSYGSKREALAAIGDMLRGIYEKQMLGLDNAKKAVEEPPTPHHAGAWERLVEAAATVALSASAGFIGTLAANVVSSELSRGLGVATSAFSPELKAGVDGVKDGIKELYKHSLKHGIAAAQTDSDSGGDHDQGASVQDALRTPKAKYFSIQERAIDDARDGVVDSFAKNLDELERCDLCTLSAVAEALKQASKAAADAQARHTLIEWMNFKARWHAGDDLEQGSRRDAGLTRDDRRHMFNAPDGFLSIWANVDRTLASHDVKLQRMALGGVENEETVVKWFRDSRMRVGDPRINVVVRVQSGGVATGSELTLWRRPDHRVVDIEHCSPSGKAWLKAFETGKSYSAVRNIGGVGVIGFPWSDADEINQLNQLYDDSLAQHAAETIVRAILALPLSRLET